ncbi:hypothetical protein N7497_001030 [Penicillium chrysogenum]|jgi:hypothetical protein|nr:hypothetical protein N7497_001030 [Penicillium chrysogenum]
MFELGILLLELWHAQSIESFAADNGLNLASSSLSRPEVARKWIEDSEDEGDMMPIYLDAATRCIECTFTTSAPKPDWNDFTFQKSVCSMFSNRCWIFVPRGIDKNAYSRNNI